MAPFILNLAQLREHLLSRLLRQVRATGDAMLHTLHEELLALPAPAGTHHDDLVTPDPDVVVPMCMQTPYGVLSVFSTITVFGTPVDVTLQELALETFFPADAATSDYLRTK